MCVFVSECALDVVGPGCTRRGVRPGRGPRAAPEHRGQSGRYGLPRQLRTDEVHVPVQPPCGQNEPLPGDSLCAGSHHQFLKYSNTTPRCKGIAEPHNPHSPRVGLYACAVCMSGLTILTNRNVRQKVLKPFWPYKLGIQMLLGLEPMAAICPQLRARHDNH